MKTIPNQTPFGVLNVVLPGPDRKRTGSLYSVRITYRNPVVDEVGCVMTWDVAGGRLPYQVALERIAAGSYRWHCTCADAIYRGSYVPSHQCKHVRGITSNLPPIANASPLRLSETSPAGR